MIRKLFAPSRYVQGPGAIDQIGEHAARLGRRALLVGGQRALSVCGEAIKTSLEKNRMSWLEAAFGGESSRAEIERLTQTARGGGVDLVIAVGGGKAIDTGKAVAHQAGLAAIVVPTIAATDAPCSSLSVIYTEDGVYEDYLLFPKNPDLVLVDTTIVANAPVELLVAGMGDALATFWEADTCARSNRPNVLTGGSPPTLAALTLARLCYDTLLEHGLAAKLAVEQKVVTPALEAIVEANTLLSGLGFESGGLAGAHSVHDGLTALEALRSKFHGQKVAFGVLTQLVLESRPPGDLEEVMGFCASVGLPLCLEDLGLKDPRPEEIKAIAEATTAEGETIHMTWFPVNAAMVESAIWTADALGRDFKKRAGNK
ncbi:MAG: glycerol dehydrogenase [Deltaproteobacteria bacterium]|nr:glycerol dehydrogenase [Deltaproteobacteria bacterium]